MNEFENKLIKVYEYKNGLFPQIPNFNKQGSAFILTGGVSNNIMVGQNTTTKDIRKGKYTQLIEISTRQYIKELSFNSVSKDMAFSFDVQVKVIIQVTKPLLFFENRDLDINTFLDNQFSSNIRRITQKYSILNYDRMCDELISVPPQCEAIDEIAGFTCHISSVYAVPSGNAIKYLEQKGKQQIEAEMKKNAKELINVYSNNYEEAIMTEVAEGKISEAEARIKIDEYNKSNFNQRMDMFKSLIENNIITTSEARNGINKGLGLLTDDNYANNDDTNKKMEKYYDDDGDDN